MTSPARVVVRSVRRTYARVRSLNRLALAPDAVVGGAPRIVRGASLSLGARTGLGPGCLCMASVTVGDDCLVSADVRLVGNDHEVRGPGLINQNPSRFPQPIVIGDDVLVGAGAMIIGPSTIGTGAVIAAGAIVKGDVASRTIVGGVPAKVIGTRDHP